MNNIKYDQDVTRNPQSIEKDEPSGIIGLLIKHNLAKDARTAKLILISILLVSLLVIVFNVGRSSDMVPSTNEPSPESLI